jgi:nicotinamidase/pyrazinamidase
MAKNALMVIDVQRDFCKGGALAVEESDYIFPSVRLWAETFEAFKRPIIYSMDYHPEYTPHFDRWPVHCVRGTEGAKMDERTYVPDGTFTPVYFVQKGLGEDDGYSAFSSPSLIYKYQFPEESFPEESLLSVLLQEDVETLYVLGLATDYCVKQTVFDARDLGFRVIVLLDGCAAVDTEHQKESWAAMQAAGAELFYYSHRLNVLNEEVLTPTDLTNA